MKAADLDITFYNGITNLFQCNPDNDGDDIAREAIDFTSQLDIADGVIICAAEYAHGVPGALKNVIDCPISSSQFPHKPTMLITASTDGRFGHKALIETSKAIEAKSIDNSNW